MISRQALRAFEERPRDSYAWMKKLPREALLDEIKTLKVKPTFKGHERWTHQLVCFLAGLYVPNFLHMLDMGLGKTAIVLDLLTQMLREGRVRRGLVFVPRLINFESWENDVAAHSDLGINIAEGSIEEKYERLINPKDCELTVIDYHGLILACSSPAIVKGKKKLVRDDRKLTAVRKQYDFFNLDEIHKVGNKDALTFNVLKYLTQQAAARYGTTGTPFGRDPIRLWTQFFLIDRGYALGEHLGTYRELFYSESKNFFGGSEYAFRKSESRTLYRFMQHCSIRYSDHEVPEVELPQRVDRIVKCRMTDEQRDHYMNALNGLIQVQGNKFEAEAVFVRLRQITSGYLTWNDTDGESRTVFFEENYKLDAIDRIIEELSCDGKIIISTEYTTTGRMIMKHLEKHRVQAVWLYGGTKDPRACVKQFKTDPKTQVLVMNSEAGGTGTDGLQSVAHVLVFFEIPPNPTTKLQTLKRVYRPGQERRTYIIDLVSQGSVDHRLLEFNAEGMDLRQTIVNGNFTRETFL